MQKKTADTKFTIGRHRLGDQFMIVNFGIKFFKFEIHRNQIRVAIYFVLFSRYCFNMQKSKGF